MQSLLTREMILTAVKEEYGSMFVDVEDQFETWEKNSIERRAYDLPCPECEERDYWGEVD